MNRKRFTPTQTGKLSAHALVAFAIVTLAFGDAAAQEKSQQQQQQSSDCPPPMRYIPDDLRQKLDAERDPKARTRVSIEVMEEKLSSADQNVNADRFEAATSELGVYEAVVEDAVRYLHTSGRSNNKTRDIFKHLEIALRAQVPHLETIRRSLPAQHAVYVRDAIEFVREQRDLALNSFYGDTVIPEHESRDKPATAERAKGGEPAVSETEKKPQQH
jgi:hypothetical protein